MVLLQVQLMIITILVDCKNQTVRILMERQVNFHINTMKMDNLCNVFSNDLMALKAWNDMNMMTMASL